MMPTKHTLYDDFTYKGKFWLPPKRRRKPRKVDGILRVAAGKHIALELFGDLVKSERRVDPMGGPVEGGSPPLIYGQTDDGQPLTLFDSFWTTRHHGGAGHARVDYTSNLCIVGAWFDGEGDVQFHNLELTLTHLEGWLDAQAFKDENRREGEKVVGLTVTHTYPDTITVDIPDPKVTFKLTGELNVDVKRNNSVKLIHTSRVDLKPAVPLSIDATFELMGDVQKFFTLMVGEQVFVRKLRGWNMTRAVNPMTKAARKSLREIPCDVFFNQFDLREAKELMAHRMTMPYRALGEKFPTTLLNWFTSLPTLRPVYNVFFATYRARRMFSESHFLHLSQAVESFDRRMQGRQYMTDAEYEAVYAAMVAAIPAGVPDGLRQKMTDGTLPHANEYSLRKRITEVVKALPKDERDLICKKAGEFAGPVADTRNNLTHVLGEPEPNDDAEILKGDQLRHASAKLELLLVMLLLKNLGVKSEVVVHRVKNCQRFDLEPFPIKPKDNI